MSGMEKMWIELTEHQPIADARGYGAQWQRMCELKTQEAANAAGEAAWDVMVAAGGAGWNAWGAARAIERSQKANELGEQA